MCLQASHAQRFQKRTSFAFMHQRTGIKLLATLELLEMYARVISKIITSSETSHCMLSRLCSPAGGAWCENESISSVAFVGSSAAMNERQQYSGIEADP